MKIMPSFTRAVPLYHLKSLVNLWNKNEDTFNETWEVEKSR